MNYEQLREQEHLQRQQVQRLRRMLYEQSDLASVETLVPELQAAEQALSQLEGKRVEAKPESSGCILDNTAVETPFLGAKTTGLQAQVFLHMAQVPTSVCHLLDPEEHPLLSCKVYNAQRLPDSHTGIRRLRVSSHLEGYSAQAINTAEIELMAEPTVFKQMPTLYRERIQSLTELTRATLNVKVEDLDTQRVELHQTHPVWLLAWNTVPFAVKDPTSDEWQDLSRYYGAFVTPNAPSVQEFVGRAKKYHAGGEFHGYQAGASVQDQVEALYNALKEEVELSYVDSIIAFSPEEGTQVQRVRLPRESLKHGAANCVDGTVLFASLLEAISMNPALIVVPGHVFLAWQAGKESDDWAYLETTKIGTHTFEQACQFGEMHKTAYQALAATSKASFRSWPLSQLRTKHNVFPME